MTPASQLDPSPCRFLIVTLCLLIISWTHGLAADQSQLTTVFLSPSAREAMYTWVQASPGRSVASISTTGSMKPTLDEQSIVIVEPRAYSKLVIGDIVLIRGPWTEGTVAHRLVRAVRGGWITKGDANPAVDPAITKNDYAGGVVIAAINKLTGQVTVLTTDARLEANTAAPDRSRPETRQGNKRA